MSEITQEQVVVALRKVFDPEIPVNVYDLGLIYDVDVEGSEVHVVMTLTSPSCPAAQEIPNMIESQVLEDLPADKCRVHIVWQPPWTPQKIRPEGRKILGMDAEEGENSDSASGAPSDDAANDAGS